MSYPKKLLRLQPTRGIIADTADHETGPDYWTRGNNVQFRDGFATRIGGSRNIYSDELVAAGVADSLHALNARLSQTNYWILAEGDGKVWAVQPSTATRIDNGLVSAVTDPADYSSALINGVPILNNTKDEPFYWDGAGFVQQLPDWTATETAGFIAVLKFHVFAMNLSGPGGTFPNLVKWSQATEPGTVPASWTPSANNDAGSTELADSPGEVLCAYPLGDSLYFYKRSAIYQARFIGGASTFQFRKVESSIGALTKRSVVDIGGVHLIVTDGDIILYDGTTKRSIGESRYRDFLFDNLDNDNAGNLFCTYNRARDEVLIAWPTPGNQYCNVALLYDVSRDAFGIRDLSQVRHAYVGVVNDDAPGNTWADRPEPWADAVGTWADAAGIGSTETREALVLVEAAILTQEDLIASTRRDALVGKGGITFGEPERLKYVRQVHVRTREVYNQLRVRVGGQMVPNGNISWSPEVTLSTDEQIANVDVMGRYIAVEIRSNDAAVWKVTGVDIEAELRGYY